ncbi:eukaryotic translation initiation factor 3 subunit D [Syncephalis pseudoplumigaleata]|uniref:Eukaryotic translation initiation factor 3 subunit D n=1 Tax=Syncephalis pseudoplumigaleata TaxID=1712513 RepID=A0A4P9YZ02_9FUNG|nr:eukaryotic translation initiation factor 3 subunit D [Syncephalis pseudoplumigaleata]|eukprot:RKP25175.1 eukaryotic translation initiation factor 3 subunit D [Syncephalis pseudoplumigaleata]
MPHTEEETTNGFTLPVLTDNPGGWGPIGGTWAPEQFKDIPYAPFGKSDKLGRAADWYQAEQAAGRDERRRRDRNRDQYQAYGSSGASAFVYQHEDDEGSFMVVDRSAPAKRTVTRPAAAGGAGGGRGRGGRGGGRGGGRMGARGGGAGGARTGGRGGGRMGGWRDGGNQRVRDASIKVGASWKILEEIEFHRLSKLSFEVDDGEDLATYGQLGYYDKSYDRVNTKLERPLQHIERVHYNITTSEDPVMQELAAANKGNIFVTDAILSMLMCATRSVNPWDILITREGNKIYMDKRDGSVFDVYSVNENAADPPSETDKETINQPNNLAYEATRVNEYFANQVIDGSKKRALGSAHPFYQAESESEPVASCAYKYRVFDLSLDDEEDCQMVVRTELAGILSTSSGDAYLTINALNEYEHRAGGWRYKLDSQRGAVVTTEMKNNSLKLARWAVQSVLANADQMRIGYITRVNAKDTSQHTILGTQIFKPSDLADQMNLSMPNAWGIIKTIVDIARKLPDGRYVLAKDPNKPIVRMYSVPEDAFDAEEAEEDEDEAASTNA